MTEVQVLPLQPAIDFTFGNNGRIAYSNEEISAAAHALLTISTSPTARSFFHSQPRALSPSPSAASEEELDTDEDAVSIFPDLPPLHHGQTSEHLRQGVSRAWDLADAHGADAEQAFFVADLGEVMRQFERWRDCLPDVEPFYAVKCNPDPYVIRLLASLGAGFDCASHGEISQVLDIGTVEPSRIIFANPCKATSFIKHSARAGVHKMTFDNTDELYKIARAHPGAELVVRILTDDSKSLCRLGLKFGAPLVTVPSLLAKARELNLNVIGVSFHVGSGCFDSNAFADAVARARLAFDMGKEAGFSFSFLDVGGGFEDANFETTASVLSVALKKHFPSRDGLRVIAEPGRFFVSTAFTLATNIIARRANPRGGDVEDRATDSDEKAGAQPSVMYYINDGVYGSFNCIMFDHQVVHPYVLTKGRSFFSRKATPFDQTCSVWGPTCDSIDCVSPMTRLPADLRVDDWLGWENMGAYTICAASRFNGFETSNITYTSGIGYPSVKVRTALRRLAASALPEQ